MRPVRTTAEGRGPSSGYDYKQDGDPDKAVVDGLATTGRSGLAVAITVDATSRDAAPRPRAAAEV